LFPTPNACILRERSSIVLLRGISRLPVRRFSSKLCAALALSRRLRLDGTDLPHIPNDRCEFGAPLRLMRFRMPFCSSTGFRSWPCRTP
jgi:hypothetical protein